MILLFVTGGSLILFTYIKFTVTNNKFKEYLLSIGDKETVRRIGGLLVPLITEIETIMEERYEQTKDEEYLLYSEEYRELVTRMRGYGILLSVLIIICALVFKNY
jgi:hypothetical protein